jgi:hypothetical protein
MNLLEKQIDQFNSWQRDLIAKMEALVKPKKPLQNKTENDFEKETDDKIVKLQDEVYFLKQRVECLEDKMSSMSDKISSMKKHEKIDEYEIIDTSED